MLCVLRKIAALHVTKQWRQRNDFNGGKANAQKESRLHEALKVYAEIDETNAGNVAAKRNNADIDNFHKHASRTKRLIVVMEGEKESMRVCLFE